MPPTLAAVFQAGGRWQCPRVLGCPQVLGRGVWVMQHQPHRNPAWRGTRCGARSWGRGCSPPAGHSTSPNRADLPGNPAKTPNSPQRDPAPAALNRRGTQARWHKEGGPLQTRTATESSPLMEPTAGPGPPPGIRHGRRIRQTSSVRAQRVINQPVGLCTSIS